MKWLDLIKRLWMTPSKDVVEQKSVEESVAGHKEADLTHTSLKKKPPAKPTHKSKKIQGWQTQFDGVPKSAKPVQVIIGFDFGTAFTKVVIDGEGQKYAVPLKDNEQGTKKYLLPSRLYEDSAGVYFIDKPKNYVSSHTDLKMRILGNNLDDHAKNLITVYIAKVLQKSRYWLMTEKQSVFDGYELKWEVNIGLPTETDTNEKLRRIYQELVAEAWCMSTEPPPEAKGDGKQNDTERLHPELINGFPEFAAQIQGYISSPQRQRGIHTLIDVGAGTVDATVFIVHREDGETKHPVLAESVKMFGTTYLAKHRCGELEQNNIWSPSPYDVFPAIETFVQELGLSLEEIECKDKEFGGKIIQHQIHRILKKAKNDHDRGDNIVDDTPANREGEKPRPLMLCGGGAQVEFYKKVVDTLMKKDSGYLLERKSLPELDALIAPGLLAKDHNRLSVAYGLSFDALQIGKITHPEPMLENSKSGTQCPLCNGGGGGYDNCLRCGGSGFL